MPLNTGTGYHNRNSFKIRANAKYSHPPECAPTSKGYFINASLDTNRTLVPRIKYTGLPIDLEQFDASSPSFEDDVMFHLLKFICEYPTLMFTRNHVSKRTDALKQRPVYAVDELFPTENMLTFPLHAQTRKRSCYIIYSLETIRGSNAYLDKLAQQYQSYFTVDWSSFDQIIPFKLIETFWLDFLPSVLVVNKGYHPHLDTDRTAHILNNLIKFLLLWYKNMIFLTQDGFPYQRMFDGIPSDLLNTQYLDSYCNLFVVIHAMLQYGITPEEIEVISFFILGDDNSAFALWPPTRILKFIEFLEHFAKPRYNII